MITLQHVGKTYRTGLRRRPVRALDDLNLTLNRGEVVGIAGPNGAGKSTLLSLLLGYLSPSEGVITLDGHGPRRYVETSGVSYLAELAAVPPRWTVRDTLARYACLAGIAAPARAERVAAQIAAFGLAEHAAKRIGAVSKGTLQRVGLAQALLRESDLIILDEPTHGLDPVWTQRFRELIARLRRPERLLLIASHNLAELERVTDRVVILHRGRAERVVTSGGEAGGAFRLELDQPVTDAAVLAAAGLGDAIPVGTDGRRFLLRGDLAALNAGLARLLAAGIHLRAFGPERGGLEDQFHDAVGEG